MSTIVLNSLNYVGSGILNGVSWFMERSKGLANAFSSLTARVGFTKDKTNVLWKLVVPVVKETDSSCGCAGEVVRTTYVDISVRMDRAATAAERDDVKVRVQNLVASPQFAASITNLDLPT